MWLICGKKDSEKDQVHILSDTRILDLFAVLIDPEELKEHNDNSMARTEPQRLPAQW